MVPHSIGAATSARATDGQAAAAAAAAHTADPVEAMFDQHAPAVFAFAARRLGRDLAQDVTADTFRIAVESVGAFDPDRGSARSWLIGIAANQIRRYWRTERRRLNALARVVAAEGDDPQSSAEERLDARRRLPKMLDAVAALPDVDRDLITMIAWEQMSYREAADALGIPVGTVASRLNRIRAVLASGDVHDD